MVRETLKQYWAATKVYPKQLIPLLITYAFFFGSLSIVVPYIVSRVIDLIVSTSGQAVEFSNFTTLFFWFVVVQTIYFICGRIAVRNEIRLQALVMRDLDNRCFEVLQRHSYRFFANSFTGALVTKVNRFTIGYERVMDSIFEDIFGLIIQLIFATSIILILSTQIGLVFLAWSLIFLVSIILLTNYKIRFSHIAAAADSAVTARLADSVTNVLNIKVFASAKKELDEFKTLSQDRYIKRHHSWLVSEYIRIYKSVVLVAIEILILYLSIKLAIAGTLSVGSIVLIQLYMAKMLQQIWNMGRVMERMEEALANASEMTEILIKPIEVKDPVSPQTLRINRGLIHFNNLTFAYNEATHKHKQLFSNFNLEIKPGQKIGLAGPSGGGKTTLTKLLLRFMDPQSGKITIDGQDIAAITQDDLRGQIAYVPQEPLLFHRSVYENISYGNPEATETEVYRAAKLAHAAEFIDKLPKGYATLVGERGVKLSGGEKQRVAIARAMLKNAPILLLDEATSSLDSRSEKYIQEALAELMKSRTTIVIAHRLSTIRKLDSILVLDKGQIIERGTHDELLIKQGLYAELWSHQSGDFLPDE